MFGIASVCGNANVKDSSLTRQIRDFEASTGSVNDRQRQSQSETCAGHAIGRLGTDPVETVEYPLLLGWFDSPTLVNNFDQNVRPGPLQGKNNRLTNPGRLFGVW